MNSHISVRIGRLPGRISEITLNGDRTVATALATAGLTADGYEVRVQGAPATPATVLNEGDLVLLVKKIKGNTNGFIVVRVGRVPGPALISVAVEVATVEAALSAAGITPTTDEVVYLNDELAMLASSINDGDAVVVKIGQTMPDYEEDEPTSFGDRLAELAAKASRLRAGAEADLAEATRIEEVLQRYHAANAELDELLREE